MRLKNLFYIRPERLTLPAFLVLSFDMYRTDVHDPFSKSLNDLIIQPLYVKLKKINRLDIMLRHEAVHTDQINGRAYEVTLGYVEVLSN